MSTLLDRRAQGCGRAMGRLFRGAAMPGLPSAWLELLRDPSARSEARWEAALGQAQSAGAAAAASDSGASSISRPAGWPPAPRPLPAFHKGPAALQGNILHNPPDSPAKLRAPAGPPRPPLPLRHAGPAARAEADPARSAARHEPPSAPPSPSAAPAANPFEWPAPKRGRAGGQAGGSASAGESPTQAVSHADRSESPTAESRPAVPPTRLVQGAAGLGRLMSLVPRLARDATPPGPVERARPSWAAAPAGETAPLAPLAPLAPMAPSAQRPASSPGAGAAAFAVPSRFAPAAAPSPVVDIDELLEALAERLRLEYLRHYGSASG